MQSGLHRVGEAKESLAAAERMVREAGIDEQASRRGGEEVGGSGLRVPLDADDKYAYHRLTFQIRGACVS